MRQEKNTILKNVLTPNSIETRGSWSLAHKDNIIQCMECKGSLFYVRRQWGIVEEETMMGIEVAGYKRGNRYLVMREIGLALYCGECGQFEDDFSTWVYPEDKTICTWDDEELGIAEKEEVYQAIDVYNHTGEVKANYESGQIRYLREKVKEYEKKNNIQSVMVEEKKEEDK